MSKDYTKEKNRYLFIIDDDPVQLEMIKDYIGERYVFDVETYPDGESAMSAVEEKEPEIVVLDYHLSSQNPDAKDGIEILKEIGVKSPKSRVFMFSGKNELEVAVESMQNGAYDYIIKGETAFNKLETTINRLGDMHQLEVVNSAQKRTITILTIALGLITLFAVLYFILGLGAKWDTGQL